VGEEAAGDKAGLERAPTAEIFKYGFGFLE